jgi:integrase
VAAFGWPALAITPKDVHEFVDRRLAEGASIATTNRDVACLRHAFKLAVRDGLLPTMPHFTLRREHNVREGFIDPPDFAALLTELRARDSDVADAVEFAYCTALRRGNVLGSRWSWVTLVFDAAGTVVDGRLTIPGAATKNQRVLGLPLTAFPQLLAIVARRHRLRDPACEFLFHRQGRPLVRFDAAWRAATTAVGYEGLQFHDLRRSAARALRQLGVDESTIMRIGNWKTAAMFRRYAITDDVDVNAAFAKLSTALDTPGPRRVVPLRKVAN